MHTRKPLSFWDLWTAELKVSFPKKNLKSDLQQRWKIAPNNVIMRLRKGKFPDLTSDIKFMYDHYGIGYSMEEGFFFDEEKFRQIQQENLNARARALGLSPGRKSI